MASQLFADLGRKPNAQERVSDCQVALASAGADPSIVLTAAEREHLQTQGYLNLGQLLTPEQCEEAKRRIHAQIEVEANGIPFSKGSDGANLRLSNLFNTCNDDGMFDICVTHPRLLAAMRLMLGDSFKLSSLNFRAASPGHGLQGYHTDWGENLPSLQDPPEFQVCNSIWMLDEFGPHNGATRVLPGTHLTGRTSSVLADATAPQPGDTLVQGPQGSVCVFSSHLFHGGTLNTTDKHRNAMHGFFTRRCFSQQVDQQKALKAKTWKRLQTSPTGKIATAILDVVDPGSPKL